MKYYKYSMDMKVLNIFCCLIFIPIFIMIYSFGWYECFGLQVLILYFFWMFLHEFLHGVGFSLAKDINHKNIVYGANLEKGIFYCMCKELISKKNIIISLMFPFTFIGVVTLIIGIMISNKVLIVLSLFNIAGCAGDIAMFYSFLRLPSFKYLDLDDCTGFVLVSENDLSKHKLFGMKLTESGDYKKLGKAKDYKKFTVSKLSWYVFAGLIILFILSFFM